MSTRDLGREAGKPTDAGTENGGPRFVDGSTDCAPRPPVLRRHFDTDVYREHFLGAFGSEFLSSGAIADLARAFDEIDRLTDERDRLQELLDEGKAAYDELAGEVDGLREALALANERSPAAWSE